MNLNTVKNRCGFENLINLKITKDKKYAESIIN